MKQVNAIFIYTHILTYFIRIIYDVDFQNMTDLLLTEVGLETGTILCIANDDGDEIDLIMEFM